MKANIFFCTIWFALTANGQMRKFHFSEPKMGSIFSLVLYGEDSLAAASAAKGAFRLVDTLNDIYSDYLPASELNRLSASAGDGAWHLVSTPLFTVIATAYRAAKASGGSFDITAGPLVRIWRKARQFKKMPSRKVLDSALAYCGYRLIEINTATYSVRLLKKGMQLDLGGIAKGETAERVIDQLKKNGFPYALLDAGGDVVCSGTPAGADNWKIAINRPGSEDLMSEQLHLRNQAVTTSGDLYQFVILNGKRFSHIVDPRTGMALTNSRNVTVISATGINADWLTKACSILPVPEALALVGRYPATEVQIAYMYRNRLVVHRSKGFASYLQSQK